MVKGLERKPCNDWKRSFALFRLEKRAMPRHGMP